MPLSGAVLAIVLIWILQVRLALAEEPFLTAQFGGPYVAYKNTVPRFLPSLTPLVASAGKKPHWLQSLAGELYFVGFAFVLAIWGWQFSAQPLLVGVVVSLGVWLIARQALLRKGTEAALLAACEALWFFGWRLNNIRLTQAGIILLGAYLVVLAFKKPSLTRQ
jgi:hypothetical protein